MIPTMFQVNWPFGSGEEAKDRFSRWQPWRPPWISHRKDFSFFFYLQVTLMLPTKFRVNWPFGSGKEAKNRFSRWRPSWISDRNDFSYFWPTSHPRCLLPSFESIGPWWFLPCFVNWPFGSGEEAKDRFSRWPPWQLFWISHQKDFSSFLSTSHPDASYQVLSQLAFRFRSRSKKIDFQDGNHGGHLGFPILTILAIFDLQVTWMLPTKIRVNWPFSLGKEAKNRFSRWLSWWPSRIPDQIVILFFYLHVQVSLMLPTKFWVNWPFGSGEEVKNRFSRWQPWRPSWISDRNDFSFFWSTSHPDASHQVSSQ